MCLCDHIKEYDEEGTLGADARHRNASVTSGKVFLLSARVVFFPCLVKAETALHVVYA